MFKPLDRRSFLKISGFAALVSSHKLFAAEPSVLANMPERSLSFYNLHTAENLKVVYWAEGVYVPESLAAINYHLRDYRNGEVREIDRRLLDSLCELRLRLETNAHFELISGYRSAATNAMLHSHSDGVAARSLHMEGMAADIHVPDPHDHESIYL